MQEEMINDSRILDLKRPKTDSFIKEKLNLNTEEPPLHECMQFENKFFKEITDEYELSSTEIKIYKLILSYDSSFAYIF
jgi:hypothetical protein